MHRILIVEDDTTIARVLAQELENWGYQTARVEDFGAVMELFESFSPHLVLLDLSLPHRSGFHWCAQIRRHSSVPIVFISSAADNMNMVTALHGGADDFVAKPFDLPVLVAKVQALLRRSYDFAQQPPQPGLAGLSLHPADMSLVVDGQKTELTRNEYRIMQLLLEKPGRIVSRQAIIRQLWDNEDFIDDNTLTVNMTRLRKKLADAGLPDCIATKKGEGYLLRREE